MAQTDTHTHGHGDSMTNSAQWGLVGENPHPATDTLQIKQASHSPKVEETYILIKLVLNCHTNWPFTSYGREFHQFGPTGPSWS